MMDVEVRKAVRVLERAGVAGNLLTAEMSWDELTLSYSRLIRDKARSMGLVFDTVPIVGPSLTRDRTRYTEKSIQQIVVKHLEGVFQAKHGRPGLLSVKKIQDIFEPTYHYFAYTPGNTVEQVIANHIQMYNLEHWKRILEAFTLDLEPGVTGALLFLMNPKFDTHPNEGINRTVLGRMYTFQEKKEEDLARAAAAKEARERAKEEARLRQETEEKQMLNRLIRKYGAP